MRRIQADTRINLKKIVITKTDVTKAIRSLPNWKAPGNDGIQGFYIKYAKKYYGALTRILQGWAENPTTIPTEYLEGRTTLIYKGGDPEDPGNFRPVTCVNVITKVFTSVLRAKILAQLWINPKNKQISQSQLGNKKQSLGAKEGTLASKAIQDMLNEKNESYFELYYDVHKAFDSVNHQWVLQTLQYYNVPYQIIVIIEEMMSRWTVKMKYSKDSEIEPIRMRRGILQGDSLSPLLFILYIDIISHVINERIPSIEAETEDPETGEIIRAKINHIYYVDDLKVIIREPQEAVRAHKLIKELHKALGLQVNLRKSGMVLHNVEHVPPELQEEIPINTREQPYKYLGIPTAESVITEAAIPIIIQKVKDRMTEINEMEASSVNYIQRVKSSILGLLRYSFATIEWPMMKLKMIDDIIKKKLTDAKMYGRAMSEPRLYVSREEFGHGIPRCRDEYGIEILRTLIHYAWTTDKDIQVIMNQDKKRPHTMTKRMLKALDGKITADEILAIVRKYENEENVTKRELDKCIHEVQKKIEQHYIKKWREQKMTGAIRREFESPWVDQQATGQMWKKFNIKKSAYGMVVRMQEGSTINGSRKILLGGAPGSDRCRYCVFGNYRPLASTTHILLGCGVTRKQHMDIHDYLAAQIYPAIEAWKGFEYERPIVNHRKQGKKRLLWNAEAVSRSIGQFPKRPDIFYRDERTAIIVDAAVVADANINKTYMQKIAKYQELLDVLRTTSNIKEHIIIPIVVSVNGLIHKGSVEWVKKIRRKVDWTTTVRNIITRNMKILMYYNGVNVDIEDGLSEESD